MRMPDAKVKEEVLTDVFGEYLLARLGAKKDLKELAAFFQGEQDALRKKLEAQHAMERAIQHALAARDDADQTLDDKVRRLAMAILGACRNNRKAPLYVKYFPQGLTAVTLAPLAEELIDVGKILDMLSSEGNVEVKAFETAIRDASAALATSMDGYAAAEKAAGLAANATRAQALLWRDAYRKIYGELIALYPSDKAYAESFFKKAPKPKKDGGDDTPPPAAVVK